MNAFVDNWLKINPILEIACSYIFCTEKKEPPTSTKLYYTHCVSIRLKQIFTFVAICSPKMNSTVTNWLKMNEISIIEIVKCNQWIHLIQKYRKNILNELWISIRSPDVRKFWLGLMWIDSDKMSKKMPNRLERWGKVLDTSVWWDHHELTNYGKKGGQSQSLITHWAWQSSRQDVIVVTSWRTCRCHRIWS